MSWASEFPPELLCSPQGFVVLTGLDVTYNAIHKTIWDCFSNNRQHDRVPLKFKILEADHEYPKCRTKRTSYEWYIPKGILKLHWMHKHLEQVPAIVVLFFDLDWDEHQWHERQMECATKVQIVRSSLQGRITRVAVVLIQKNAPMPPGEDVIASERAASLCSACELSAKSLFVLPHTDHLTGYVIRLENAFYELTQSYYHTEARKVKAHKEFLNKTTHQLLFVRHQFKIGFYNELKQDSHTALKHYKQGYTSVLDIRLHDTNVLEIKTIAGYINYKICHLSFQHNAPLDAIAQFRKHIDFFKSKIGISDLAFEHSAWMAIQFQMFGDLFDEAIKLGLTAIQTQHPGFYYQQSALHSVTRKKLCQALPRNDPLPDSDVLENLNKLDYYGQRPWRQGNQSIEPSDVGKEKEGIIALQNLEHAKDHSWIIIPLLNNAVTQFKKYKSPHMKIYLMVQLGEEFYHAKSYKESLRRLKQAIWPFRTEGWKSLLTSVLTTALRCSYLIVSIQDYIVISLELLSHAVIVPEDERLRIHQNLFKVLACQAPDPEPVDDLETVREVEGQWSSQTSEDQDDIQVDMHNTASFIQCKSCFMEKTFKADCKVVFKVYIKVTSPLPVRFTKLSVLLSNKAYDEHCIVTCNGESNKLYLSPDDGGKVFDFSFYPEAKDVNQTIKINSIVMELGCDGSRSTILHWSNSSRDVTPNLMCNNGRSSCKVGGVDWNGINLHTQTHIEPRDASLDVSISHEPPVLVAEFYELKINITNNEETKITDAKLIFGLKSGADEEIQETTFVTSTKTSNFIDEETIHQTEVILGDLEPQQQVVQSVFVRNMSVGDRIMLLNVSYLVTIPHNSASLQCMCCYEQTIVLPTVQPFTVDFQTSSMLFEECQSVHTEESFLLEAHLVCTSPWPIKINSTEIKPREEYIKFADEDFESQLQQVCLSVSDMSSECCCLVASMIPQNAPDIGSYTIQWQRQSSSDVDSSVSTSHTLPPLTIDQTPFSINVEQPSFGYVRQLYVISYTMYNRTAYPQDLEVTMETSDSFMFMGHKQIHFRILPEGNRCLSYSMYPLIPGTVQLPQIRVNMLRYPGMAEAIVQKMVPTNVYVKPSVKQENPSQKIESG